MLTAAKFTAVASTVVYAIVPACLREPRVLDEYVGWHECLYMSSAFWSNKAMHISAHAPASVGPAGARMPQSVRACVPQLCRLPSPLQLSSL